MRIILTIATGPAAGKKIRVASGRTVTIGREGTAGFPLPADNRLSAVHFELKCGMDECTIQDRNSTNGTLVNGSRVAEAVLRHGDTILAGETRFTVSIAGGAPPGSRLLLRGLRGSRP